MTKSLTIKNQKFHQLPLTPWLSAAVIEALDGVNWGASQMSLMAQLLRRVHVLAALILIPDGYTKEQFYQELEERPGWIDERTAFFKTELGLLDTGRLVKDFLLENDLASFLSLMTEIMQEMKSEGEGEVVPGTPPETPTGKNSTNLSRSLVVEMPVSATPSEV